MLEAHTTLTFSVKTVTVSLCQNSNEKEIRTCIHVEEVTHSDLNIVISVIHVFHSNSAVAIFVYYVTAFRSI